MIEPDAFRADRYLRASAYHIAGWSLAAMMATIPAYACEEGRPWPPLLLWLYAGLLLGAGSVWSFTSERRAMKIAGPAAPVTRFRAGRVGGVMVVLAATASVPVAVGAPCHLPALWLLAAGAFLILWGRATLRPYLILGALQAFTAAVIAVTCAAGGEATLSRPVLHLWNLALAAALPCAWFVHRRYLLRF